MSLRWRFALVLAASTIAASAAAGAAALWSTTQAINAEVDTFLEARVREFPGGALEQLARQASAERPIVLRFGEFSRRFDRPGGRSIVNPDAIMQIVDDRGDVTVTFEGSPAFEVPGTVVEPGRTTFTNVRIGATSYRIASVPLERGGALIVARDITENLTVLARLRARIFTFGLGLAAAAAAAGWFIAGRTVRPVEELSGTAQRIATTRDLTTPITVDRDDELGQLARSFNTMLAALRDSQEQQHRLVTDASHELRTPLTSLRTNIEVLQRGDELSDADHKDLLEDVGAELRELTALVSELVDLATDRQTDEPTVAADLADIAAAAVDRSRRRTGRTIVLTAESTPVRGRPGQLDRVVWNLLENADKWSPDGAPIEVVLSGGRLEVRDHGSGIPDADLDHVFERFYRAASARTLPGSGLGLAIVAQIVEGHGGRVFAANRAEGGAVVGFTIPID